MKSNSKRSYKQACGVAKALDVVGERWTLLIVRNLLLGPLGYSELRTGLPGITTNLLAKRLREMESSGLMARVRRTPTSSRWQYRLTERGRALEAVIHALGAWGWPELASVGPDHRRSVEWLLVSLRRRYAGDERLRVHVIAGGASYAIVLDGRQAQVSRGPPEAPDLTLEGTGQAVSRLFLDERAPKELDVRGEAEDLDRLLAAFPLAHASRSDRGPPPNARAGASG